MLKNRRNYDNVSIAQTKSSKTLKSKLNNNPEVEVKKFQPPYFKEDTVRNEIEQRARKQNEKGSKGFIKPKEDHLGKAGKIVQDLMKKHKEAKQKLNRMKEQAEKKTAIECPFKVRKGKVQKFIVGGNVIRRNQIWLQEKKRKQFQHKEILLMNDLNQCTFTPTMSPSRKESQIYLKNRSKSADKKKQNTYSSSKGASPLAFKRDISPNQFQSAKRQIFNRLLGI